jgi:AAA15 family ATPase/GTPase
MRKQDFEGFMDEIEVIKNKFPEGKQNKPKIVAKGTLKLENHLFEIKIDKEKAKMQEILFKHNDSDVIFTFGEESDGTRRLIELLDVIYNNTKNRTVIIDELDRSMHPQMTIKFVETFLKYSKSLLAQLIITTHESNLMDLKLLRRDEIWFVERDLELNETKLYSLERFKVHNTKKVAKDYLIGRYGAVPVFKDFDSYLGVWDENTEI